MARRNAEVQSARWNFFIAMIPSSDGSVDAFAPFNRVLHPTLATWFPNGAMPGFSLEGDDGASVVVGGWGGGAPEDEGGEAGSDEEDNQVRACADKVENESEEHAGVEAGEGDDVSGEPLLCRGCFWRGLWRAVRERSQDERGEEAGYDFKEAEGGDCQFKGGGGRGNRLGGDFDNDIDEKQAEDDKADSQDLDDAHGGVHLLILSQLCSDRLLRGVGDWRDFLILVVRVERGETSAASQRVRVNGSG